MPGLVLNVDDDPARRHYRSVLLRDAGFAVQEASTGAAALEAVLAGCDVMLLDVSLPDMDGFEVCRRAKGDPRTRDVPVIHVSSARITDEDWARGLAGGADHYLIEPVDPTVLIETIRRLVERHRREQAHARERVHVVEALSASEERYRALFMNAPYGIYTVTREGYVVRANHALVQMLGYKTVDEVCALNSSIFYENPVDREALLADWESLGQVSTREVAWWTRDGRPLIVCLTGRLIADTPTSDERFEVFVDNVTTARRIEAQMRHAQKMDAIGRLAAGIAHDFNNLLTVILGYTELMLQQIDAAKPLHADLREVQKAGQHGATLTRQLLAFSRKQALEMSVLDINEVVHTAERLLRRVMGDRVTIVVHGAAGAPRIKADRGQLEQVLVNLAVNACDAMPDGGTLTIAIASVPMSGHPPLLTDAPIEPGPYVRVSVTDSGIGMDAATQAHLFEPFFSTKDPDSGTGLGLTIVHGIVRQFGGHIGVTSAPRQGTTFDLYFPESAEAAARPALPSRTAGELGRETVLLVDDDAGVLAVESTALSRHGYRVLTAATPETALSIGTTAATPVDVILTDVVMPGMSGPALAARLRSHGCTRVVYMSGYERGILQEPLLDDRTAFIQKPFKQSDLLNCIRRVLDAPASGCQVGVDS